MADRNYKMNVTLTDGTVIDAGTIQVPEAGGAGKGIESIDTFYAVSDSGTSEPSDWREDPLALTVGADEYFWTRLDINFTDSTAITVYMKAYSARDGADGTDGEDGVGVTNVQLTEV